MLLIHQTGSVKIGEVVRYTVTYTPADDRILPAPNHLYLRIKNTSTVALRAAFIHGPYTLYVSSAPQVFNPNEKLDNPRRDGVPEFEPNLKAGGTWYSKLSVPEDVREDAGGSRSREYEKQKSMTWVIEVASQVIFSNSAAVHYEILLGRDEKSLHTNFMGGNGQHGVPGQVKDHQQSQGATDGHHSAQSKGVFSKAVQIVVEDTATLWNKPRYPEWRDGDMKELADKYNADGPLENAAAKEQHTKPPEKQKNVHLVILTHGLHSNLGADMLYMKESIDEATAQAKIAARKRRRTTSHQERDESKQPSEQKEAGTDEDEDDEEVLVRGFSGNAVRTEKGIKYLGKRLAKYVLAMTYPDQPFKPITKTAGQAISSALKNEKDEHGLPIHANSTIREEPKPDMKRAYKVTSISFIAHSLGGLIQTYAVAYIQKHSPEFFNIIKPINFVAMATPFLGLSNENPLYVKFALDFGLVGRTGKDLGLTWRAPTLVRGGWSSLVGGIGESAHKKMDGHQDPGAKPLLRILPTGPAHVALKKFRNRTVYSNVVNDGIVPLRTSCLLFLDWSGLGKVEKARRENGLIGTIAQFGWAELTGANASHGRASWQDSGNESGDGSGSNTPTRTGKGAEVPQPTENATDDDARSVRSMHTDPHTPGEEPVASVTSPTATTTNNSGALDSILNLFKSNSSPKSHNHAVKPKKIYQRSQTLRITKEDDQDDSSKSSKATSGEGQEESNMTAPPKTTFFESAGDLIAPPMPPVEFLIDPAARARTIFHDRVYHPDDIPPPPLKRRSTTRFSRKSSYTGSIPTPASTGSVDSTASRPSSQSGGDEDTQVVDGSAMKVEEKIARAYHRDLSWRKVLVRLEPDAHNNMIVRRKFANAYGWPVIKHLVDTHFSDSVAANTRDEDETNEEQAKDGNEAPDDHGGETKHDGGNDEASRGRGGTQYDDPKIKALSQAERSHSEAEEATDRVPALNSLRPGNLSKVLEAAHQSASSGDSAVRPLYRERQDSAKWSDKDFEDSDDESDDGNVRDITHEGFVESPVQEKGKGLSGSSWNWTEVIAGKGAAGKGKKAEESETASSMNKEMEIRDFLAAGRRQTGSVDGKVGLGQGSVLSIGGVTERLAGVDVKDKKAKEDGHDTVHGTGVD